jgi:AmmeMemoRadiSam system protein A
MFKQSETTDEKTLSRSVVETDGTVASASEFSAEQRRTLLGIAHSAILAEVGLGSASGAQDLTAAAAELSEPRGVFTTLYLDGNLRGCVGYAMPVAPLYRAVAETARAAAFEDSRFSPVAKEEARQLGISLSVLSRLAPVRPEDVEVGRHGLVISAGGRRGLLLPQVPGEYGWDRETFLEQTCRKAGLPSDAWRKDATIEAFTAEVFSDSGIHG